MVWMIMCLLAWIGPALADSLSDARRALDIADFLNAAKLFRPLAEEGNAEAQFALAEMYDEGEGVAEDHAQALRWYRLAAGQGYAAAQTALGRIYSTGAVVSQDFAEAFKWDQLAAQQGVAMAQFELGWLYRMGDGAPRDHVRAYMWFDLAAQASFVERQRDLFAKTRDQLAAHLTDAQLAQARSAAANCKSAAYRSC